MSSTHYDHEQYLTAKEAAVYLRSSPSTLAKRRLYGNGPLYVRLGVAVRYRIRDLDAWMASTATRSTSAAA
jgi:predicted DNA-binding transcriptional regulator AlpA